MKSRRIIPLICIVSLVIVSFIFVWKAKITILEGLGIVSSGVIVFKFVSYILDFRNRENDVDRLKHSKDLIENVFKHLVVRGHVSYIFELDEIRPIYVKWEKSNHMFQYALQHLENNREIYAAYMRGQEYGNKKIDEMIKKLQQYRETVEQKLIDAQIQIPISEKFNSKTTNYNKKLVKTVIFYDIQECHNELLINTPLGMDLSSLHWSNYVIAVADTTSLEYLKDIIEKIIKDETVRGIIMEYESLNLQLENNTELERFNHYREEIVRKVENGQKPLDGKCDYCPD